MFKENNSIKYRMYNTTFIKYFYLLLLFCVLFITIYNDVTQEIGFKFLNGVQAIYFVVFMFQLLNDKARSIKAIRIDIPKSKLRDELKKETKGS